MSSDERPGVLAGRRVVVTRARAQAAELGERLAELGAEVLYCPAIRIAAPADPAPLRQALQHLRDFDWLILTSVNGVEALVAELERQGRDGSALAGLRVACVGPATAAALRARNVEVEAMPAEFVGSEIAALLEPSIRAGQRRVLLARGAGGNSELPERLHALGAEVREVETYRSVADQESLERVRSLLSQESVDIITFTSPSTVTFFIEALGAIPAGVRLAAIGPVTATRMKELNLTPDIIAPDHTIPGLVAAVSRYFGA